MQSYKDDQLLQTLESADAVSLVKEMPAQATHSVIGKIPAQGDKVVINGLTWVVERVKPQHGWMRLRLQRP